MDQPTAAPPPRRLSTGRLGWPVALLVFALLAVAGVIQAAQPAGPPTQADQAAALAAELRCPTCQGLSVADSSSPLARSMRTVITEQLAAGHDPAEIRAYFVDRYGAWVLLEPPAHGLGWLVWIVPLLALLVGVAAMVSAITGWRPPDALRWGAFGIISVAAVAVVLAGQHAGTATAGTGTGGPSTAAADTQSSPAAVAPDAPAVDLSALQAAVARHPADTPARLALAAVALEAGRPDITRTQAAAVLARDPANPDALLLRGLAPERAGDPVAVAALRRFLAVAPPNHPGRPLAQSLTGSTP
ncbi:MAG: cytochrome c-type biogenesis protein CcmH [Actinobacteria bacterium]|nr:cytochrome c-type biogenesis protein CcmH [Actinomycetota bacterium]MBI3686554.1 cytochrome c-type biogenesis protein CcmH [Actinomycetota bacterium]